MELQEIKSGYLMPEDYTKTEEKLYKPKFHSKLAVFNSHNGFISGEIHTLVGSKGAGKSTWARTIISEVLYCNKTMLLYLSEEEHDKYVLHLNRAFKLVFKGDEERVKEALSRVLIISEITHDIENEKKLMEYVNQVIRISKIDIFLFDNFTTSFVDELNVSIKSKLVRQFKNIAVRLDIPFLIFFHTSKGANTRELNGDNVRGTATAVNIGSYNYVLHQDRTNGIVNYIYCEKARYHDEANGKLYKANYDHRVKLFTSCEKITKQTFDKEIEKKKAF